MTSIPLTHGMVAVVDDEDYARLAVYKWRAHKSGKKWIATRNEAGRTISIHREILPAPPNTIGWQVHHLDGDKLNNRRANLELRSKFKRRVMLGPPGYRGKFLSRIMI